MTPPRGLSASKKLGSRSGADANAKKLFNKICHLLYERFKREDGIDELRKKHFIENIDSTPPLTEGEHELISESTKLVKEVSSQAKRIAGTVDVSVEKYFHRDETGIGWAFSVAKVDVPADTLFAHLWLIDTYAKKAEHKGSVIREVWTNLDGTRSQQYTRSFKVPGFQDRIFEAWRTWVRVADGSGRPTFILVISPLEQYNGTHHKVAGTENMVEATSKAVFIIKGLTEDTCEWTRAQSFDLNITAMPIQLADILVKQLLSVANEVQEKYKRNDKEVDQENVVALAELMRERRGEPLMGDQVALMERCKKLLGDGAEEGWKTLESTSRGVEMKMKYFPPKKGGRSVATGKAMGLVDGSAEEVAAWLFDYCSNERMRISKEQRNPARLELREKARVNERTMATIKKFPFVLHNREFVARQVWKSEKGKVLFAFESVHDEVDYGTSLKKVRAFAKGFYCVEHLANRGEASQCRLTLVLQSDAGGSIPTWVVNFKVPQQLRVVQDVIDEFKQDEKVDDADWTEQATFMRER